MLNGTGFYCQPVFNFVTDVQSPPKVDFRQGRAIEVVYELY